VRSSPFLLSIVAVSFAAPLLAAEPTEFPVGVATQDITPKYAVRLSGFGSRRTESEGVTQRIFAKALAIGDKEPAVLITVDNLGVPASIRAEVAKRLQKQGVAEERLAICASHTHTAPMLTNVAPTLFGMPIPKEHQEHIDQYTKEFIDALEKVALAALADRKPSTMSWGIGKVEFAMNRRTKDGPVDHDLPVLVVRSRDGKLRAVWASYACHCVTLSNNKISGDWAGYAQQAIQDDNPGATALISIGCGADQNPNSGVTGDKTDVAQQQGRQVADEVKRLLKGYLAPVSGPLTTASKTVELPLADPPSHAELAEKAKRKDAVGYHASVDLARLDRGEKLKAKIDYPIVTWAFGDSLAFVFLPGEVVVDYSVRLKKELDNQRIWINAYSNDAPCYIPSERVLKEGGYEGGGAMIYYDLPGPFKPGLETQIIGTIHEQIGKQFAPKFDPKKTGGVVPLSPQQSLAALRPRPGLAVDLVAAEPLVTSPVAIDFGPDGRLWVCEMYDYPSGLDGKFGPPAGRIRVLEDTKGTGIFDKSTVFLDKIPFPTGILVWRKGVLICAAPDILYAEDTKGTGKADVVKKLYSGFGTDNYQARVNSLQYGLDGWVYGSCGLFGGKIQSHLTGKTLDLGDRDFRIKPDTGEIEPATGRTQQGRVRDDWDNWFGCDNSELCRHYVLADHYLRRNPHAAFTDTAVHVPDFPDWNRLYPARQVQLFKLSGPPNRVTSACGIGIYRDDLIPNLQGDVLTCEPVNLLVTRLKLTPKGSTFSGRRVLDEAQSEFLASLDNWFRPVQVRTGPDGAIWVVDMYRFVIEHPRWIPPEDLKDLDVRAGATMGRIYRIRPSDKPLRPVPRLDKLDTAGLVKALDTTNGTVRDLAGQMLLWKNDASEAEALEELVRKSPHAEVRMQALCILDGLKKLTPQLVRDSFKDPYPGVRRHAVRLAEQFFAKYQGLGAFMMTDLADENDAQVRLQRAYSFGQWNNGFAGSALGKLLLQAPGDPHLQAAVLSSVNKDNVAGVFATVTAGKSPPEALVQRLVQVAAATADRETLKPIVKCVTAPSNGQWSAWQLKVLPALFQGKGRPLYQIDAETEDCVSRMLEYAWRIAPDTKADETLRLAAINVVGLWPFQSAADVLLDLVSPQQPGAIQSAALAAIGRSTDDDVPKKLLARWKTFTPTARAQILDFLLGRESWLVQLLASLENGEVPSGQIDAVRRQRLLTHKAETVRQRASKIFATSLNTDRQRVIKEYSTVLSLKAEATRGRAVFVKNCSVCHRLENTGHEVGPDLTTVANKTPAYLLQEILDPNLNVDSRYIEYRVETKNGRSFTGLLASESSTSITLRAQEGKTQTLLRSEIEELSSNGKSLMPEGQEKDISKQDMADLLAYLTSQGKPPKQFPGNNPIAIKANQGRYLLRAADAAIFGNEIAFEQPFGNIGMWHGQEDHAAWTVEVEKEGSFDVWLDFACANDVAGNAFVLEGGKSELRGKVPATGGWDKYQRQKIGAVKVAAGTQRLTFRPDAPLRGALLDLRAIQLVPEGEKPVWISK
jgi:putative membrane-bound dehydrogenase-like protein